MAVVQWRDLQFGIASMLRLALALMLVSAAASAADKTDTIILSDPQQGRTLGKIDGETVVLQRTPTGTIGKIGKDKVILHKDGRGNTMGKVGDKKIFCHSDPVTGFRICK